MRFDWTETRFYTHARTGTTSSVVLLLLSIGMGATGTGPHARSPANTERGTRNTHNAGGRAVSDTSVNVVASRAVRITHSGARATTPFAAAAVIYRAGRARSK